MEETYASELIKHSGFPDQWLDQYTHELRPLCDDLTKFCVEPYAEIQMLPIKLDQERKRIAPVGYSRWYCMVPGTKKLKRVLPYIIHNQ